MVVSPSLSRQGIVSPLCGRFAAVGAFPPGVPGGSARSRPTKRGFVVVGENAVHKIYYDSPLTSFGQQLGLMAAWPAIVTWNHRIVICSERHASMSWSPPILHGRPASRLCRTRRRDGSSLASRGFHLLVGNATGVFPPGVTARSRGSFGWKTSPASYSSSRTSASRSAAGRSPPCATPTDAGPNARPAHHRSGRRSGPQFGARRHLARDGGRPRGPAHVSRGPARPATNPAAVERRPVDQRRRRRADDHPQWLAGERAILGFGEAGNDHPHRVGPEVAHPLQKLDPRFAGHTLVAQDDLHQIAGQHRLGLLGVLGAKHVEFVRQHPLQRLARAQFVVDDQNRAGRTDQIC